MQVMNKMLLANRTKEIDYFQKMVSWNSPKQILLLESPPGFGKTDLLLKFAEICPEGVLAVQVNLKSACVGIPYVFWRIKNAIGPSHFPRFKAGVQNYLRPDNIIITDNEVLGQMDIQLALGSNEQTQKYHLMELQEMFFQDLQKVKKTVVILFDTFNEASTDIRRWLSGAFLAAVTNCENLRVVIAGQSVPERNCEWDRNCHKCHLGRIDDEQAWYEFTQEMELSLSQEIVAKFVAALEGNPKKLKEAFETLSKQ